MTMPRGLRRMLEKPGASLTVMITLSLGIGLPAVMFGLIRGALLTSLPYEGGERIVRIERPATGSITAAEFEDWSSRQRSFDVLSAVSMGTATLAIDGRGAEPVAAASLHSSTFALLSVAPAVGRPFGPEDAEQGVAPVALVSDALWRDRLDGASDALGTIVRVNGRPVEIVGIMPEGFGFPLDHDLWMPLALDPLREAGAPLFLVGRLREGVSAAQAAEELTALAAAPAPSGTIAAAGRPPAPVRVVPFTDMLGGRRETSILSSLMLGLGLLVLLVACANVANVLLAGTVARRRELAIRTAMGGSRGRVARQLLGEIGWLAAVGAVGGTAIAAVGTTYIQGVISAAVGAPYWIDVRTDLALVAFVILIASVAAFAAGLAPALHAAAAQPQELLREGARDTSGLTLGRVMRRLVGVEMALSFVLLVGAGLFVRSASNVLELDIPFRPEGVYAARIRLPSESYPTNEARHRFLEQLPEALTSLADVERAVLSTALPGVGASAIARLEIEGTPPRGEDDPVRIRRIAVSPGFFGMFDASLRGRDFDLQDRAGAEPVAIVNTAFERAYLPDGALGRRVLLATGQGDEPWRTVVGVTTDLMAGGLEQESPEAVYIPLGQERADLGSGAEIESPSIVVLARPVGEFASLPPVIREAVAALGPDVPLFDVRELRDAIDAANSGFLWISILFLVAGSIALFLASIGLYGVISFWVTQRTREIGVRMALGGRRRQVIGLVMRQGLSHMALGLLVGLAVAIPAATLVASILFDVSPYDPLVFGTIIVVLGTAASLGCWIPARRATRIDPMEALRAE
jgi:putative ABC transport system permease protein